MDDDLVKRLESSYAMLGDPLHKEAADRIEQLEAALREIAWSRPGGPLHNKLAEKYEKLAVVALEEKK